ncbi:hypothetical protein HHL11_05790 [Ramlibacter sp. G-1-2-2]|uniref:Uncharacterized protein n=1 Tax=Ramlibacter agri TaxID=2728837 RepID=A0A848H3M0_9BURK|nr:hypothetical protein [Ramlibacter agri]NML43253.1 hypothetical protein [Ramlibacter agri]
MSALVYFDRDGAWGETLVCEGRIRGGLQALGVVHGRGKAPPGVPVLRPQGEAAVFYLALADGWAGLLCEAGEWVAVPEGLHVAEPPAPLPAQDSFIGQLLALMGEDGEEA